MATKDLDDMIPRPLPRPSQLEEICTRPEVPEVSLVFDSTSYNPMKYNTPSCYRNETIQQHTTTTSAERNQNLPVNLHERNHSFSPNEKGLNHFPFPHTFPKTPNILDEHNVSNVKKVSFSPLSTKNDTNPSEKNPNESTQCQRSDYIPYCSDSVATTQLNNYTQRFTPDGKKTTCSCTSCNDTCDYSLDHANSNNARILKNLERKINTKVSFDDLQKTELKIENILLKHKCKYDKLGENCVTKDELNRVVQKYENQISLLQFRLEELTQKLNYSPQYVSTSCGREIKKCNCSENQNYFVGNQLKESVPSGPKFMNRNCCPYSGSNLNIKCNHEVTRNYGDEVAVMTHDDRLIHKETRVDVQIAAPDKDMNKNKICRERCCNDDNSNTIRPSEPLNCAKDFEENRVGCHQMQEYHHNSTKQYNDGPHLIIPKSSTHEPVYNHAQRYISPQNFPNDHRPSQEIKNDKQSLKISDKNVLLDWTFYNNIVENVTNVIQQNPSNGSRNGDTADLIKKATIEQLQKMGINVENNVPNESLPENNNCQKKRFNTGNSTSSPDMSFRMNSLAMKYVSDIPTDGELYNKKSGMNDISFRSNGNNVSIATLQYMERYQLLPGSEYRNGGNPTGCNKYEQTISQEHHHKLYKQTQNNDRSFIR